MRWKVQHGPQLGDRRVERLFALWPIKVDDEYVWMEFYYRTLLYTTWNTIDPCGLGGAHSVRGWKEVGLSMTKPREQNV